MQRQHQHVFVYDEVQYHANKYKIGYNGCTLQLDTAQQCGAIRSSRLKYKIMQLQTNAVKACTAYL